MGKKKEKHPSFAKMVTEALRSDEINKELNAKSILDIIKSKYPVGDDADLELIHRELQRGKETGKFIQVQGESVHGIFKLNLCYTSLIEYRPPSVPGYLNPPVEVKPPVQEVPSQPTAKRKPPSFNRCIGNLKSNDEKLHKDAVMDLHSVFLKSAHHRRVAINMEIIPHFVEQISGEDQITSEFAFGCLALLCENNSVACKQALEMKVFKKLADFISNEKSFKGDLVTLIPIGTKMASLVFYLIEYMFKKNPEDFKLECFVAFGCIMVLSFYADEKSVVKLTASALHLMHFNNKLKLDFVMPSKIFEDQRFASIYDYADAHRRLICAMAICVKIFPLTLSQHMDTQTVDKMFQCFDYHDDQDLILLALVACRLFCCDDEIEPLFMAKCSPNHVLKLYPFLASKNNDVSTNATYVFGSFIKKLENNASDTVSLIFPAFNQFIQNVKKSFEAENLLDFSKTMLMRDIYQKHGSLELLEKMCVSNQTQSVNYLL